MTPVTTGRLPVDGATLHYEVRGRGPLLLLIPGGTSGAAAFDGVADALSADHTVVSYDPRGFGRSPLDDPAAEQRVSEHADDAHRLLTHLEHLERPEGPGLRERLERPASAAPARVFGASSGAIVALRLLVAHPERLALVVAHEPPLVEVLPDAAAHRELLARVRVAFREHGAPHAMAVFAAGINGTEPPPPAVSTPLPTAASATPALPPQAARRADRAAAGLAQFIGRIVPSFMAHAPDLDRLAELRDRLVLAAGHESRGEALYRPVELMAEQLGTELRHFPGGHLGLTTHPAEFGAHLREVLAARP